MGTEVKTEAEMRIMQGQSKEHLEPPEIGRGEEEFFLQNLQREALLTTCLGLLTAETEKIISVVLSHPVGGHLLQQT